MWSLQDSSAQAAEQSPEMPYRTRTEETLKVPAKEDTDLIGDAVAVFHAGKGLGLW